jgi:hypothetical protein
VVISEMGEGERSSSRDLVMALSAPGFTLSGLAQPLGPTAVIPEQAESRSAVAGGLHVPHEGLAIAARGSPAMTSADRS